MSEAPTPLAAATRSKIIAYVGVLIILLAYGSPHSGLVDTPITFFVKNRLKLSAHDTSIFRLLAATPLFVAFAFGFVRDTFNPFGLRDRGFLILFGGLTALVYAVFGFWRPASVFDNLRDDRPPHATLWSDLKRLAGHWPIYPALTIWLLWSFAPGSSTPLAYFIQNTLHGTDADVGNWNALFIAGFIPTFLLFGWLCQRYPLRRILFWSTLVAVPQMVPLAFIHTVPGSLVAAFVIGFLGGVNSAAYLDLVIRSSPPGLQGTVMMLYWALFYIAVRFGDVLGAALYDHFHDFNACVIAITVVYALILPILWLVPRRLTATRDGEVVD